MRSVFNHARRQVCLIVALLATAGSAAYGVEPGEMLDDPGLETRARNLSAELRCVVCQNQSIDDSDAPLAKDLRLLVRERLKAGDTNSEVKDYLVARYGTFVLLKPPFNWQTVLLWVSPFLIVLAAFFAVYRGLFQRRAQEDVAEPVREALSDAEQKRLDAVLQQGRSRRGG